MFANHININKKYLEALENDDWKKLPGEIYAKNFLKKYCNFLKLNPKSLNIDWQKIPCFKNKDYTDDFKKKTRRTDFFNLPKFLKIFILILIMCNILSCLADWRNSWSTKNNYLSSSS